ncbi:hypothetical protein HU200_056252 [Digitaria exilis]|uniref:BTB domain-containing protein n=1 Tax=Digitaria exilis TaxID=1010633 RepID=A0A835AGC0_9POAL|nr:hypothetical protein HU200_056252 [Digitaria exilis]
MGPPSKPQSTPPSTTTTSTCTVEAAEGTHLFHVEGYSLHERLVGGGKSVRSATFSVGGYDWAVRYCPEDAEEGGGGALVLTLELLTKNASATASCTFRFLNPATGAHKIVLAMWSPVFKAKFYGPEMEDSTRRIAVDDVRPAVFRALLHFIYTDSMPDIDDLCDDDDRKEMFRNLLVAADRLSTDSVATTLALAEKHNLCNLKDTCLEFVALSNKIDDVVASEGYSHLKRSCPSVLLEILEKSSKLRRV